MGSKASRHTIKEFQGCFSQSRVWLQMVEYREMPPVYNAITKVIVKPNLGGMMLPWSAQEGALATYTGLCTAVQGGSRGRGMMILLSTAWNGIRARILDCMAVFRADCERRRDQEQSLTFSCTTWIKSQLQHNLLC